MCARTSINYGLIGFHYGSIGFHYGSICVQEQASTLMCPQHSTCYNSLLFITKKCTTDIVVLLDIKMLEGECLIETKKPKKNRKRKKEPFVSRLRK
jgi:hypothetical protein